MLILCPSFSSLSLFESVYLVMQVLHSNDNKSALDLVMTMVASLVSCTRILTHSRLKRPRTDPQALYALALDPDDVSLSCSNAAWIAAPESDQDWSTSIAKHTIALPLRLMGPTVGLAESPWSLAWLNFLLRSLEFRIPVCSSADLLRTLAVNGHLDTLRVVVRHLDVTLASTRLVRGLDIVSRLLVLPVDHIKRIHACLAVLIVEGIGVDYADAEDYTPLMRAVALGDDELVKLLIQSHVDVHHLSKVDRATAWSLAIELELSHMAPWLS